jgi:hypothetical protein
VRRNLGKYILKVIAIIMMPLFIVFAGAELLIGSGVRSFSHTAQAHFPGNRVESLIAMVECKSCDLQDRNHAVWALGQLKDPRALQVLEKYVTGAKCDHRRNLCQDTLQTALRHLRHKDNSWRESLIWRWMLPIEN